VTADVDVGVASVGELFCISCERLLKL
jgi:hypothetical protein